MDVLKYLNETLLMEKRDIISFSSTAPHRYKVYEIPKRNSQDKRTIAHPSSELKFLQRALILKLSSIMEPSDRAYAYVRGRNIKDNALQHVHSHYLLKMDFSNFFPSITPELLFSKLSGRGVELNEIDKKIVCGLLFWKPKRRGQLVLSIGAPSSPLISNFVMKDFDERITAECERREIVYTRYADDLTFSTKEKDHLFEIPRRVKKILNEEGYDAISVKDEKTVFSSKAHNRHVTGVTLTNNNKISLGRKKKRKISAMVHHLKMGTLPAEDRSKLRGYLSFAEHIEPGFNKKLENKYGRECLYLLKK